MKMQINQNLIVYTLVILVLNIVFRLALSFTLENEMWLMTFIPPVVFFFAMYFTGRYFGLRQWRDLPTDYSFQFHLATFSVFFIVSYSFAFFNLLSKYEPRGILDITLFSWGIGLLIHFIQYRNKQATSIKGIARDEIFD
jgi:hypothetical protein